jgi:dephospho-CoA kinase
MKKPKGAKKKIILGVTGSFGSGKSTVAAMFGSCGAEVVDADKLAHACLKPGTDTYARIIAVFGKGILRNNNDVDRRRLARVAFGDKASLKRLNRIIHPEVIRQIKRRIKSAKSKLIILDAPLLLEAGLKNAVDKLIVVKITREKQIERIKAEFSLSRSDILRRIRFQIPLRAKAHLADFVIDNSATIKSTRRQVEEIYKKITAESAG